MNLFYASLLPNVREVYIPHQTTDNIININTDNLPKLKALYEMIVLISLEVAETNKTTGQQ